MRHKKRQLDSLGGTDKLFAISIRRKKYSSTNLMKCEEDNIICNQHKH